MTSRTAIIAIVAILALSFHFGAARKVYIPVYYNSQPVHGEAPDYVIPKWLLFGGLGYAIGKKD